LRLQIGLSASRHKGPLRFCSDACQVWPQPDSGNYSYGYDGRMQIHSLKAFSLSIPFRTEFSHAGGHRSCTESIIVRVLSRDGIAGYGEGTPRSYVTGETVESSLAYIRDVLWPAIAGADFAPLDCGGNPENILSAVSKGWPELQRNDVLAFNAAICALELAIIDCILKTHSISLSSILPPVRNEVFYSGVIGFAPTAHAAQLAGYYQSMGLRSMKVKTDREHGIDFITAVRAAAGDKMNIRLDANGAYSHTEAETFIRGISGLGITCFEQPIKRGDVREFASLQMVSPVPLMADESLVTMNDAAELVRARACSFFNLRISKCGGIFRTLRMAKIARAAGIRMQIGCLVGETAILSAVGRTLAAYLPETEHLEGSFGSYLLCEDVSAEDIRFGRGGRADLLSGPGLGITVRDDLLEKYRGETIVLEAS